MTISGVLPYIVFMVAIGAGVVSSFGVNPFISSQFSFIMRSTNVASLNENTTNKASSWNDRLEELKEYRARVGDTLVPKRRPSPLGNWVNKQRQRRKKGKMKGDQIRALDNLGFIWDATNVRKSVKEVWWERFQELKEEIGQSGYASIKSNSSLGYWINLQRKNYILFSQSKDSVLTPGKIEALNAIEFPWKSRRQQLWDMRIQELNAYKGKPHCIRDRREYNYLVPITYTSELLKPVSS
jgi:hypothetical protein